MRDHIDGDFPHGNEFQAIAKEALGQSTYVVNGVSPSVGTGDYEVDLTSGTVRVNGTEYSVSGTTITIASESTLTRRYDLIYIDNTGTVQVKEGTEDKKAPASPADACLIAIIRINSADSSLGTGDVKDARIVWNNHYEQTKDQGGATGAIDFVTAKDFYGYSVADDNAIKKINPDGSVAWSVTPRSGAVEDVAVTPDGYVYVAYSSIYVMKLASDGTEEWEYFVDTVNLTSIAVDSRGYVYVGTADNDVLKISPEGNLAWTFSGHGNTVNDVAVDRDYYVYSVSDDTDVKKIKPDGTVAWTYSSLSDNVLCVAVDSKGYVFVGDADGTTTVLGPEGNLVMGGGIHTAAINDIAVDSGYLYTCSEDNRVYKLGRDFSVEWEFTGYSSAINGVRPDPNGYVITCSDDNTVRLIAPDGTEEWKFTGHTDIVNGVSIDPGAFGSFPLVHDPPTPLLTIDSDNIRLGNLRQYG